MSTATRVAFAERTVPDRTRWMPTAADLSPDPVSVPVPATAPAPAASGAAAREYRELAGDFACVQVHADLGRRPDRALVQALRHADGRFRVSGETARRTVLANGVDAARLIDATRFTDAAAFRSAYDQGVRRYLVGSATDLEPFAGAPHDTRILVPIGALRAATAAGIPVAGLSLDVPAWASPCDYVAALAETAGIMADARVATGRRFSLLDLGTAFPGRAAHPAERAELARAIRALVSPATSGVVVTASTALVARGHLTWAPAG